MKYAKPEQAIGVALIIYYLQAKFPGMLVVKHDIDVALLSTQLPKSLTELALLRPGLYQQFYSRQSYDALKIRAHFDNSHLKAKLRSKLGRSMIVFVLLEKFKQYLPIDGESAASIAEKEKNFLSAIRVVPAPPITEEVINILVADIKASVKNISSPYLFNGNPVAAQTIPVISPTIASSSYGNGSNASRNFGFFNKSSLQHQQLAEVPLNAVSSAPLTAAVTQTESVAASYTADSPDSFHSFASTNFISPFELEGVTAEQGDGCYLDDITYGDDGMFISGVVPAWLQTFYMPPPEVDASSNSNIADSDLEFFYQLGN
jgi:hypothetical protein